MQTFTRLKGNGRAPDSPTAVQSSLAHIIQRYFMGSKLTGVLIFNRLYVEFIYLQVRTRITSYALTPHYLVIILASSHLDDYTFCI